MNPGRSGSNPCWYFSCPVAVTVAMVRPWNEFFVATISKRSSDHVSRAYFRAILIAASFASAPELAKNTRSANECSVRSFARWICGGE